MDVNNYTDIWGKHLVRSDITCCANLILQKHTILKNVKTTGVEKLNAEMIFYPSHNNPVIFDLQQLCQAPVSKFDRGHPVVLILTNNM